MSITLPTEEPGTSCSDNEEDWVRVNTPREPPAIVDSSLLKGGKRSCNCKCAFTLNYTIGTPWYYFLLILPLINGLITSVMLETGILMRGQMDFRNALSTALGMSFISMLMMEIAMEITDLLFTKGELGLMPLAIPFMLVVGFLTPWPYNYWRLKKYGVACH